MKNLLLSVFLSLVVVCPMQAQRVNLPIGEDAVTEYVWRTAGRDGKASIGIMGVNNLYVGGGIPATISSVTDVLAVLPQVQLRTGEQNQDYFVQVDTYVGQGTNHGSRLIFKSQPFKLVDGKIPFSSVVFPSETDIASEPTVGIYGSTVAIWSPDTRWVEIGEYLPDLAGTPYITRNGWNTNCWASALFGNGYVYLDGWMLSGRQLRWYDQSDPGVAQYVTLWYDEDRTIGDRWDIGSGVSTPIGYSPSPKMAIRHDKDGQILVGASGCTPGTSYTIVTSVAVGGGSETVLGTITAGYDGRVSLYTRFNPEVRAQFFSIRIARTGDPLPQPTAVPTGASFP